MFRSFAPVIKNSHFLPLWSSQILSQITINLVNFILVTKIFENTGSTIAVSFLWISYALPAVLLLPIAGPMVDTMSRKAILFFTNLLQGAAILLFLPIQDKTFAIFPLVFLYSALNQFYLPAEAASIPDLVDKKSLSVANSLFFITSQITFIAGFGMGGILIHALGYKLTLSLASLLLLIASISVTFLPENNKRKYTFKSSLNEFWRDFIGGFSFIKNQRGVLFPLMLLTAGFTMFSVMGAIFPLVGRDIIGSSARNSGTSIFIPVGLGALIGSLIIPRLMLKFRKRKLVEFGLASVAINLVLFSLIVPNLNTDSPLRLIFGAFLIFVLGLSAVLVFIPSQTVIQERTPDILRGRILSALSFVISLSSIIPLIFGAAIAEFLGIKTFLILIALIAAMGLYYSRRIGDKYLIKHGKLI